jgi:hypothetical protein
MFHDLGMAFGGSTCQYRAIRRGAIAVDGMPEGITFKHPRWWGRNQLVKILDCVDNIKFRRKLNLLVCELLIYDTSE